MMGIVSIILWALVITLMVNFLYTSMSTSKSTKISYSEFLQMVREDKVEQGCWRATSTPSIPRGKKAFGVHASGHLSAGGDPDTGAGKSGGGGRRRPV